MTKEPHPCNYVNFKKSESLMAKPELETLDYKPEQPNPNAMIIKKIQGLMTYVSNELDVLNRNTFMLPCQQPKLIAQALEDINTFEKTTLFDLQKAFE